MSWFPRHSGEKLSTSFFHRQIHYSDDPAKDDRWAKDESLKYGGMDSARWRREMEIDWDVYMGQRVWPMISRRYHHAPYLMDKQWAVYRVIDHGIRHPTCCLWVGVNVNGDRHYFREYYQSDASIGINCKNILQMEGDEMIVGGIIDPSTIKRINYNTTAANSDKQGLSRVIDIYEENGIYCEKADNSSAGYDKVTDGLLSTLARWALYRGEVPPYLRDMDLSEEQYLMLASKPAITFDMRNIRRAYLETENLRWKDQTGDPSQRSEPEKTVDVRDEGPDCVRYGMQSEITYRRPVKVPKGVSRGNMKKHLKRQIKKFHKWA